MLKTVSLLYPSNQSTLRLIPWQVPLFTLSNNPELKPSAELVKRLRALTLNLLPVEVDPLSINDPTSRVITPQVITAYRGAAGDFAEAVRDIRNVHDSTTDIIFVHASCHTVFYAHALSLCGMRIIIQRITERTEAEVFFISILCNLFQSHVLLAIACEVLARRIVHLAEPDRIKAIMSTRYQHRQIDGEESEMSSALEMAIDQHWFASNSFIVRNYVIQQKIQCSSIFLSSSEAQDGEDSPNYLHT